MIGIYSLVNTSNGKLYIGQSIDLEERKKAHIRHLKAGNHHNEYLQNDYRRYGPGGFEFRILEIVPEAMLDIRECAWIDYYSSYHQECGYNLETGGGANRRYTEVVRQKVSEAGKRRMVSEEARRKISKALKGRPHSIERRKKLSEACMGKKRSALTRKRISEALKRRQCSEETRRKISEAKKRFYAARRGQVVGNL